MHSLFFPHFTHPAHSPTIIVPPSNKSVNELDSFFLMCVTRGLPTPTVEWFEERYPITALPGVKAMGDWLIFERATEAVAGVYWCNASNVVNSVSVTVRSASATVEVFSKLLCLLLIDIRDSSNGCGMFDHIALVDMGSKRLEASNKIINLHNGAFVCMER